MYTRSLGQCASAKQNQLEFKGGKIQNEKMTLGLHVSTDREEANKSSQLQTQKSSHRRGSMSQRTELTAYAGKLGS